jgi:predicted ArsR family transcriptional regulator
MPERQRMGPAPARGASGPPALTAQRAALLEAVQHASGAVTTSALAAATGLHENTIREHLDALIARGLVRREPRKATGRGRPAMGYVAAERSEPDPRVQEYVGLATALAGHIARTSDDPASEAREAGRAWSGELDGLAPQPTPREARQRIVELFDELGFAPETDDDASCVALRRCPLLDAAERYPEVICAAHRGLAEGTIKRLGGDPAGVRLKPFAAPGACHLWLNESDEGPASG